MSIFDITPAAWYVDVVTLAGVLVALGTIWRLVVWPFFRAVWAAILAAPKIATGMDTLISLVEGDVLAQLAKGRDRMDMLEHAVTEHDMRISLLDGKTPSVPHFPLQGGGLMGGS